MQMPALFSVSGIRSWSGYKEYITINIIAPRDRLNQHQQAEMKTEQLEQTGSGFYFNNSALKSGRE